MATKIYLPSSGSPDVTPSSWIFTNQINPVSYKADIVKAGTTMTTKTEATGTTNPTTRAMVRWVIGPLAAQTISGTVRAVIRCRENNAGANATLALACKIIQSGGSDRATLLAVTASDSATSPYEMNTTLDSRRVWTSSETEPLSLTSQDASAGDYLVIEMGFRSATGTTRNIDLRLGDSADSDLTYGDGTTSDFNGWVEFSGDISFESDTFNLISAQSGTSALTALGRNTFALSCAMAGTSTLTVALVLDEPEYFTLHDSVYIPVGGETTTAQLTAPDGKTEDDFQTGFISGRHNPLPDIDLDGTYTEVEWSLVSSVHVSGNDVFQFRVTVAGTPLDEYAIEPQVIIQGGDEFNLTSDQNGTSALAVLGRNTFSLSATMAGTSALTVAGFNTFSATSAQHGTSAMTVTGAVSFSITSTQTGTSMLAVNGLNIHSFGSTMAGASTLTASGFNTFDLASDQHGASALTVSGIHVFDLASAQNGISAFTVSGFNTFNLDSVQHGTSALTVEILIQGAFTLSATMAGTSALTAPGINTFNVASAHNGTSSLTADLLIQGAFTLSAAMNGESALTVAGVHAFGIVSAHHGTSALMATGVHAFNLASVHNGVSAMTIAGVNVFGVDATHNGTSAFTVAGFNTFDVASAQHGTSILTAELFIQGEFTPGTRNRQLQPLADTLSALGG